MKILKLFVFTLIPLISLPAGAIENPDPAVHLAVTGMERPEPPHFIDGNLIVSYDSPRQLRFVGAAFEHEQFRRTHAFFKNDHGVFVLIYPVPDDKTITELRYRIVADGLWIPDPTAEYTVRDMNGLELSRVPIPPRFRRITEVPFIQPDGRTRFIYSGAPGNKVYIAGGFNNWDPFMHRMTETDPGTYEITLRLQPGEHFYYFVSNGLKVLDPRNPRKGTDYEGTEASLFRVTFREEG